MNTKLILIALIGAFMFTSCEKDEVNLHPKADNIQGNKNPNSINKSTSSSDSIDVDLSQFIGDVLSSNSPSITDVETALLYTESTLYWRLNHPDLIPGETQVYDLEYTINVEGGEVNGSDLLQLNNDIYDELVVIAESAETEEDSDGEKFWFEMDVIIPDVISSPLTVQVKAMLGFNKSNNNCSIMDDWKGYLTGRCLQSNQTYVTSILTAKLNDPNCSYSNVEKCSGFGYTGGTFGGGYVYNNVPTGVVGRYNTRKHMPKCSFLWNSTSMTACITSNRMNTYYLNNTLPSIPWWGNWQSSFNMGAIIKKIKSYRVDRVYANGEYQHEFDVVYYDACTKVVVPGHDEKPRPSWI